MSPSPRVVLGLPAFNRPDALRRTLESLLSQTYRDFAVVVVDDGPTPGAAAIVAEYAPLHPRLTYEANATRRGMVGNWRRVFARGRELYPDAEYFAWVSDHDVWHPHWLHELVAMLDREPAAVLAYPESLRMRDGDNKRIGRGFETRGLASPGARMRAAATSMLAGDMIYGLMRSDALEAAGIFRAVVTPDRQLLLSLSLFGEFHQVHEPLWYREFVRPFSLARQREVFFPGGAPLYAYLPSHLQHFLLLLWDFGVRGRGRPRLGRVAGARCAVIQLVRSTLRQLRQRKAGWRSALPRLGGYRAHAIVSPGERDSRA
jgi:glycosyltransferase involved in cell wall biosynthesis